METPADDVHGRILHAVIDITLTPPQVGELGKTDNAFAIGCGLIREVLQLLQVVADAEGFDVDISVSQCVY